MKLHSLTTVFIFFGCTLIALTEQEHFAQAILLSKQGKKDEAIGAYQRALACNPSSIPALFNLANEFYLGKNYHEAIILYKKVTTLEPNNAQAHYNLGIVLALIEKPDEALTSFESAVGVEPGYDKARHQLGLLYHKKKQYDKAEEQFKVLLAHNPKSIETHRALTYVYRDQEKYQQAIEQLQQALQLQPNDTMLHFDLGFMHTQLGNVQEAISAYQHVVNISPNNASAYYNIGYNLKMAGNIDEAIEIYLDLIKRRPDYENAYFALGRSYMQKGDFQQAWPIHERHLKEYNKNAPELRTLLKSGHLKGKTILMRPEGGLGDTLQFIRYAQLLKELGATVVAYVQKPLLKILAGCNGVDTLLPVGTPLPHYDAHVTMMSLPAIFNSDEATIPHTMPYIHPDPALVAHWQKHFVDDSRFKIGICWQADVYNDSSRAPVARRGIPLTHYYTLSKFNVSLYSLQQADGLEQLADLPATFHLNVFPETFDKANGSFMDTAAVMHQLDLVITIDTAIAHLAGAMGRRVWLLLPYSTDWRWLTGRTDTPWYPTMRIFQQPKPFDWTSVMHDVESALAQLLEQKT